MLIYCVRHGESVYNAEGRIQGQSDVPLSELGLSQSRAVARALAGLPIAAVYSSPLRRALQTAEPLAASLGVSVETDPRLMEIHAGVFQDQLRSQLPELFPEEYARWLAGEPDFTIPGGECRRDLMRRGREVFETIAQSGHEQVAVVTHGGLLAGALKALLGIPAERHPFVFQNGSITRLELADGMADELADGRAEPARLLSLNESEHLRGLEPADCGDL